MAKNNKSKKEKEKNTLSGGAPYMGAGAIQAAQSVIGNKRASKTSKQKSSSASSKSSKLPEVPRPNYSTGEAKTLIAAKSKDIRPKLTTAKKNTIQRNDVTQAQVYGFTDHNRRQNRISTPSMNLGALRREEYGAGGNPAKMVSAAQRADTRSRGQRVMDSARAAGQNFHKTPAEKAEAERIKNRLLQLTPDEISGTVLSNRERARRALVANSIAWHRQPERRAALEAENEAIRRRWGWGYDDASGITYDAGTGEDLSAPVEVLRGKRRDVSSPIQRAALNEYTMRADIERQGLIHAIDESNKGRFVQGVKSVGNSLRGGVTSLLDTAFAADDAATAKTLRDHAAKLMREKNALIIGKTVFTPEEQAEIDRLTEEIEQTTAAAEKWENTGRAQLGYEWLEKAAQQQQNALQDLTGGQRFLAQNAMSIANNAAMLPLAAINPALPGIAMGAQAAGSRAYELTQQGAEPGEALTRGLVSGGIEGLTERFSVGNLLDMVKTGGKGVLLNILKQAGIEGSEEMASYALNYLADKAAQDPNAAFSVNEMLEQGAGGALSGGVFGAAGTVANNVPNIPLRPKLSRAADGAPLNPMRGNPVDANNVVSVQAFTEPLTQTLVRIDGELQAAQSLPEGTIRDRRVAALREGAADVSRKLSQIERNKAEYNAARTIAERFGARMELRDLGPAGGMYENGVIIINPYTDSPVRQVLVHELTHHLESSGQYARLQKAALDLFASEQQTDIDALRQGITALYAKNGVTLDTAAADRELTAAFCENRLFTDEASIQRLAQTDAGLFQRIRQWIADAVARLRGTPEERRLMDLQRMYEKAARTVGQVQTDGGAEYSIRTDANGDTFIDVTEDILNGKTEKDHARILSDIIQNKFGNIIQANGQTFGINSNTNSEWRRSKSASSLYKKDRSAYLDKIRAFDNADELMTASHDYVGEGLKHPRKDRFVEFARGKVSYRVGQNGYTADVIVGIGADGRADLYDIVNIQRKKITEARILPVNGKGISAPIGGASAINNSIPQTGADGNPAGQNTFDLTPQEIAQAAMQLGNIIQANGQTPTQHVETMQNAQSVAPRTYSYRYTNNDSPMSDLGHAMFVDNDTSSETYGRDNAYRYRVDHDKLRDISEFRDEIISKLNDQYDSGILPLEIEEMIDNDVTIEEIADSFNPDDIVMSADAWDNGDLMQWFYDNIAEPNDVYGFKTADGAIVFDEELIEREDNPSQYLDSRQNLSTPIHTNIASLQAAPLNPTAQATQPVRPNIAPDSSVGAAQSGFDPYTQMANEYGTIQPGENPARIVDVPRSTDGSDKVRQFARTAMEAKVTPDEMIPAFEQNVQNGLFSYHPVKDKSSLDMAVKTIDQLGIDGAMAQWAGVTSGRRAAGKEDIVLAELLYSKAAQMGDTQTAMKLAAEIAAEGTRAGQTVQALRLLKRTTPEGKLYYIKKSVDNLQRELDKKRGDKAPRLKIDEMQAVRLLGAQTEADADKAIDAIYDDVAKQIPPTFGDRLNAWRYFAMLGNPRTHIRNVVGNMVMQLPVRASNKLSASLQGAFLKDPEQRTRSLKRAKGAKEFAKADFEQMKNVLSGNAYTSEMSEIQQRQRLFPRPLQAVMDVNTNALDAEDAFFKKMTYINSLADFLSARGVDLNNVPADVLEQGRTHAIEDAKKATFQDASALADKLSEWENTNKFTKLGIGGFLPFKRTPINIVKRGFEYSPAGLIKGLTADLKKVRNGTMDATEAIDHIAQGLTGTAIAALGYFLASNDLLSASEPENDKEREFGAAQGSQEYALNIGDYSYTIDWAAPAALPLFVGAEFYNALTQKYDGEEQAFNQAVESLSRLFEPMINMTMLSGVGSTIQSAQYSNTNPIFAVGENIVQNYAGQVVPTLLGQIARTADDTRRTTYVDKESWVPGSVQKFMQRQANKIPGLSKMQPAYTDVWGREDKTESVVLRAFENFLSPGYINKRKTTDAEKALQALYDATGDTAVLPSKPQKSYTIDGVKHNLSANEWLKLTNEKGRLSLDAVDALTKSAAYQTMSDAEKVSAVKDVYDYAAAVAANSTYGKELEGVNKTVHDSKIDPGLYFAYKEMQDTLNETLESYEARDAVFQTIRNDSSLSEHQKNQLYYTLLMQGTSQSQFEKYQAISDKVTAEEYVDAMIQSQAIKAYGDELEEGRATAEATEFSFYLDQMGYTGEKRNALANTFKFYNMFPAEPKNYTFDMMRENGSQAERENVSAIESSGISAAQYMQIKTLASGATWEKGKSGAKLAAYGKIVSENTANYDQYAAVMRAMGYKNIGNAYTGSGTLPDAADMISQVSRSNTLSEVGINPVAAGEGVRMGSGYGYRDALTAGASTFHEGNDIPAPMGTPVVAYKSGTVSYVGDSGSGGNMVQIDHPDGTKSVYMHLQDGSFAVKAGDKVGQGQQIAKVGSTGRSTGPHLDFRIMVNGKYVDPKGYYPGY